MPERGRRESGGRAEHGGRGKSPGNDRQDGPRHDPGGHAGRRGDKREHFSRRDQQQGRDDRRDRGQDDQRGRNGQRGRDDRRGQRGTRPDRGTGSRTDRQRPPRAGAQEERSPTEQAPEIPEDVEFGELDAEARRDLRTLPKDLAERIGRHLVTAGRFMDTDLELALAHARYAKSKASRVPVVREALGLVAYHAGEWSEALTELRAVRRMTRSDGHIAVIADAERAMGRPERALDLAKEIATERLSKDVEVELRIVTAGARRDLGQLDAAVVSLQGRDLESDGSEPWRARLRYAYADNLLAAGRDGEALRWFLRAAEADPESETDAAERAAELGQ